MTELEQMKLWFTTYNDCLDGGCTEYEAERWADIAVDYFLNTEE